MAHTETFRKFKSGLEEVGEGFPLVRKFILGALRGGLGEARGRELPANKRERRREKRIRELQLRALRRKQDG